MADWVHCNLCGQTYARGVSFFITTCSHIFCHRCKEKGVDPCAICRSSCKVTELNSKLDSNLQIFFSNLEDLQKKFQKVMKFQDQHRAMLNGHLKKKIEQQSKMFKGAEDYCRKVNEENKQLKYDNSVLKKYIYSLKANMSGYSNHRPATPRQLHQSPMASPQHCRSKSRSPLVQTACSEIKTQSPAVLVPMTPRNLAEIQNTQDQNRLSIRLRTKDGRMGTPSPRTFTMPVSTNSSRISSPMVASTDENYRRLSGLKYGSVRKVSSSTRAEDIWPTPPCTPKQIPSSSSVRSTYFSKFETTPSCTSRRPPFMSQPSTPHETPLLKFSKSNFR